MIESAIRRQASYILADPWANSFRRDRVTVDKMPQLDKRIGELRAVVAVWVAGLPAVGCYNYCRQVQQQ